jgi:Rieske Fe-S protein
MPTEDASRRSLLRGVVVVAASLVGGYMAGRQSSAAGAKDAGTAANDYGPAKAAGERRLAALDDVPVSGGLVLEDAGVVLTRDSGDKVRAFSSTCTHQGCPVSSVADGVIVCPCHNSQFDAATGAPTAGPATRSLPSVAVVVRNGAVYAEQGD